MDNKKGKGLGGMSIILMIVAVLLIFWVTNQSQERNRSYTLDQYREAVESQQVESAVIYQDKAVPTGQIELHLADENEVRYVNISNVSEEEEYLREAGVECELAAVPKESVFMSTIFPTLIMVVAVLAVFAFMRRQSGMNDGGAGAKAMNLGKAAQG